MSENFKKEFIECTKNEGYIDLPKEILDRRMEFLSVVDELINHKLPATKGRLTSHEKLFFAFLESLF